MVGAKKLISTGVGYRARYELWIAKILEKRAGSSVFVFAGGDRITERQWLFPAMIVP